MSEPRRFAPHELRGLVAELKAGGVKVLSLDCFDTLVWRTVASPYDVFVMAARRPEWVKYGVTAELRVMMEREARARASRERGSHEVTLAEIMALASSSLDGSPLPDHAVAELVRAELDCELEVCVPYGPVVVLAEEAMREGLTVAVVSDTYLSPDQLREVAPSVELLDQVSVFCSSVHRKSKSEGLIATVAESLGVKPSEVVHLGDNHVADVLGAEKVGARGYLFDAHDGRVDAKARAHESFTTVVLPEVRASKPLHDSRKIVTSQKEKYTSREELVGYSVVGPIVHAFVHAMLNWELEQPADQLRRRGDPAFLMRDGYLPSRVFETVVGSNPGSAIKVDVSRFTATASSMMTADDVEEYMDSSVHVGVRLDVPAGHVHLDMPPAFAMSEDDVERFKGVVRLRMSEVLDRSAAMRSRLRAHLVRVFGSFDDVPTLVDLGYTGTAEKCLRRAFPKLSDVRAFYLINLPTLGPGRHLRRGVVGDGPDDYRIAGTLMKCVAPLEIWCARGGGSVVDYTEEGEPIFAKDNLTDQARRSAAAVQDAALAYVRHAEAAGVVPSDEEARQAVVGLLGALGYLPTITEFELLQQMALDVNLGTDHVVPMVNLPLAARQLYRRGFGYLDSLQERSMVQGAEVRAIGVELSLAWLNVMRYGVTLTRGDMTFRKMAMNARVTSGGTAEIVSLEARATHDGFSAVEFPNAGAAEGEVGFLVGAWSHFQVEAVLLIPFGAVGTKAELSTAAPVEVRLVDAAWEARGLGKTESRGAMVVAPTRPGYVTRMVFRPLTSR